MTQNNALLYTLSKKVSVDLEYNGGCKPDEDPADYITLSTPIYGVIIA
jgi:hypothetical protein